MKKLLLLLFCFTFVSCTTNDPTSTTAIAPVNETDKTAIEQLCHNYAKGMNDRDAQLILSLFVDDGTYITRINKANRMVTKKRYEQLCPGKFAEWNRINLRAKPKVKEITVNGLSAEGSMSMKYSGPGWSSEEHYVMKFEKRDDKWVITSISDK